MKHAGELENVRASVAQVVFVVIKIDSSTRIVSWGWFDLSFEYNFVDIFNQLLKLWPSLREKWQKLQSILNQTHQRISVLHHLLAKEGWEFICVEPLNESVPALCKDVLTEYKRRVHELNIENVFYKRLGMFEQNTADRPWPAFIVWWKL